MALCAFKRQGVAEDYKVIVATKPWKIAQKTTKTVRQQQHNGEASEQASEESEQTSRSKNRTRKRASISINRMKQTDIGA